MIPQWIIFLRVMNLLSVGSFEILNFSYQCYVFFFFCLWPNQFHQSLFVPLELILLNDIYFINLFNNNTTTSTIVYKKKLLLSFYTHNSNKKKSDQSYELLFKDPISFYDWDRWSSAQFSKQNLDCHFIGFANKNIYLMAYPQIENWT